MRRTIAFLFAVVLVLFSAVGCGPMDSSSSDDGANAQSATTTVTPQPSITHSLGKATLPLTGFCGVSDDNKIIIQTDYAGYESIELMPSAAAFAYRDGEMIQLKPFDFTLKVNQDFSSLGREATVPVRYFVMDSTVYAYAMAWPDAPARFVPIPRDSQHVLLTGGIVKRMVKVNVVTGACEFLTMEHPHYINPGMTTICSDEYIVLYAGHPFVMQHYGQMYRYVYHFKSRKLTEIGDDVPFVPWYFVGDSLFMFGNNEVDKSTLEWYEFYVSTGELKPRYDLLGYMDLDAQRRPYRHLLYFTASDGYETSGKLGVANLKTSQSYTVKCRKNLSIVSANESGNIVMMLDWSDEKQKGVYSFIDMKTGRETSLSAVTPHCVDGTYKGYCILGAEWCGENAVLINYTPEPDNPDQSRCLAEVIELPKW